MSAVKFPLGQIEITPRARDCVPASVIARALRRHERGDWGRLAAKEKQDNDRGVDIGHRLVSAYRTKTGVKFWIITEGDRSVTTVLLPSEY